MPLKAEYQLKLSISQRALHHLSLLQGSQEDSYANSSSASSESIGLDEGLVGSSGSAQVILDSMNHWIEKLSKSTVTAYQSKADIMQQVLAGTNQKNAASTSSALVIIRTLMREYQYGLKCLQNIIQDLELLR